MTQAVTEFQTALGRLADQLGQRIALLLNSLSALEKNQLLSTVTDLAPDLVTPFVSAAADLTAVWYEAQDPTSDFTAVPSDLPSLDELAASARWAVLQPDPVTAWSGAATKSLFDASRQTVVDNADKEGVKWARYAREDACGFCRLLSVKGYFYTSEAAAKAVAHKDAAGHSSCNCVVFPQRGPSAASSDFIKKYEPILNQWNQDYRDARKIAGKKAGAIANAMDYLPGGRRYKGDAAQPYEPRPKTVNLDQPAPPQPEPRPAETDARMARRLLPGLESSLENLRAQGLAESSPQIQYHLTQIARWKRALATAS